MVYHSDNFVGNRKKRNEQKQTSLRITYLVWRDGSDCPLLSSPRLLETCDSRRADFPRFQMDLESGSFSNPRTLFLGPQLSYVDCVLSSTSVFRKLSYSKSFFSFCFHSCSSFIRTKTGHGEVTILKSGKDSGMSYTKTLFRCCCSTNLCFFLWRRL